MSSFRQVLTSDFKSQPYWFEHCDVFTEESQRANEANPLPAGADVVVIGAGYTGLHAALPLARAGRHVVVLEAEAFGHGCSSRNGGQVSTSIKPTFRQLVGQYGEHAALALMQEGYDSVDWLEGFIRRENLDCQFNRSGSFVGAHTPGHFRQMQAECENEPPAIRSGAWLVEPDALPTEIGTTRYAGGVVYPLDGSLQPAQYLQALSQRAMTAGVEVHAYTQALSIDENRRSVTIRTNRGNIVADQLIVATNGYTGECTPSLRRRVIPVGSYMIATEAISPALINSVLPTDRVICDSRKVIYYYRPSPDRRRVVFGGRVSAGEIPAHDSAPKLHAAMVELFPQLQDVKVSHVWRGYVAFTFDNLAHAGRFDQSGRMHYALGYCGSGIAMSSYFGARTGHAIAGTSLTAGYLDRECVPRPELSFKSRPFYSGQPWFLSTAVRYYRWRDRLAR